ncbi:hypothetical protein N0V95_009582 [Ascochyta clinopodiicola]|nr:hypothetical protein N0V95_009582 [Ascochyta clinopodiicola]
MMHLDTNDVWSNISPDTILGAYSKLVDQMRASKPITKILVAKILPMNPPNCADCGSRVVALDSKIDAWAKSKSTSASPITVVDAWTGFNTASMTVDGVHPNDAGAKGLANSWFQPLSNTIKSSA